MSCIDCDGRGETASRIAGFPSCWGYDPKNRLPNGYMKCFHTSVTKVTEDE